MSTARIRAVLRAVYSLEHIDTSAPSLTTPSLSTPEVTSETITLPFYVVPKADSYRLEQRQLPYGEFVPLDNLAEQSDYEFRLIALNANDSKTSNIVTATTPTSPGYGSLLRTVPINLTAFGNNAPGWNNSAGNDPFSVQSLSFSGSGSDTYTDLRDSNSNPTGFTASITSAFSGIRGATVGFTDPATGLEIPDPAAQRFVYVVQGQTGAIQINGLDTSRRYKVLTVNRYVDIAKASISVSGLTKTVDSQNNQVLTSLTVPANQSSFTLEVSSKAVSGSEQFPLNGLFIREYQAA